LQDLQIAFQAFRGKGGDVYGVVVKRSGSETKVVQVQEAGDVVTDEGFLLQAA
jgi:hypothetical protein